MRQRKTRTALTVSGIVIGVAMILVLLSLAAGTSAQTSGLVRNLIGAEITVANGTTPQFNRTTFSGFGGFGGGAPGGGYGGFSFQQIFGSGNTLPDTVVGEIGNITGVYATSVQLSTSGYVDNGTVFLNGIDPSTYSAVTNGLNIVNGTSLDSSPQQNEIVLDSTLASNLNVTVGDVVTVGANSTDVANYTVVGLYSTGSTFGAEARSAYITLANAQSIANETGQVSEIYVKATDSSTVQSLATIISSTIAGVRVTTANGVTGTASSLSSTLTTFFTVIGLVALLAGGFGVVNTMMMSISERTREIGTLRAIGARRGQVMKIFMSEAVIIGLIGAVVGLGVGIAVTLFMPSLTGGIAAGGAGRAAAGLIPGRLAPTLTAFNLVLSLGLGTLVGILAGIYPAWRATRMDPVEALRHV
ncbi:MAG: FtsX-like permease family protein [Conexivisphaerales archaeon]